MVGELERASGDSVNRSVLGEAFKLRRWEQPG
jgi:hypothetical protein